MNQSAFEPLSDFILWASTFKVLFIVFFFIWIAYIIRLWLVQTATFQIQKDLEDIKYKLLDMSVDDDKNKDTKEDDTSTNEVANKKGSAFKKPRLVFTWLAAAIPLLVLVFIYMSLY